MTCYGGVRSKVLVSQGGNLTAVERTACQLGAPPCSTLCMVKIEKKSSASSARDFASILAMPLGLLRLGVEVVVYVLLVLGMLTLGWVTPEGQRFAVMAMLIPAVYCLLLIGSGYWQRDSFPNANRWLLLGGAICLWGLLYLLPIGNVARLPEAKGTPATAPTSSASASAQSLEDAMRYHGIEEVPRMLALDPYKAPGSVRHLIAWVGLTLALMHIVRRRSSGLRLFYFLGILGVVQGLIGAASLMDPSTPFARGTFYNRNHFGALMAMLWPLMFAALRILYVQGKGRFAKPMFTGENPLLLLGGLLFLATLGFIASTSRGAILLGGASVVGYICHESFLFARRQSDVEYDMGIAESRSPVPQALKLLGLAVIFMALLGIAIFLVEMRGTKFAFEVNRIEIWLTAWRGFTDHWIMGVGPGGGHRLLDLYATGLSDTPMIYSHSEWVEIVLEFGALGTLLLGGILFWAIIGTLEGWRKQKLSHLRTVSIVRRAAGWGCVAAMATGLAEFHLRIPSIQIVFSLLFAMWVAFGYSNEK